MPAVGTSASTSVLTPPHRLCVFINRFLASQRDWVPQNEAGGGEAALPAATAAAAAAADEAQDAGGKSLVRTARMRLEGTLVAVKVRRERRREGGPLERLNCGCSSYVSCYIFSPRFGCLASRGCRPGGHHNKLSSYIESFLPPVFAFLELFFDA